MTPELTFVLLVLATSRLRALIQVDHLTERFRELVIYNRWPYDAKRGAVEAEWLADERRVNLILRKTHGIKDVPVSRFGYWFSCPWCLGTWLSVATVAATCCWTSLPAPVLWAGAVAYAVGLMARLR